MNSFELIVDSGPNPRDKWIPVTGGLLVGCGVAYLVTHLPPRLLGSWKSLFGWAAVYVLAVFLASAVTAWGLCAARPSAFNTRHLTLRTALGAIWMTPLAVFLTQKSPWALAVTAVFVASLTKSMRLLLRARSDASMEDSSDRYLGNEMFSLSDSSSWLRGLLSAIFISACAQTAALAGLMGYRITAAVLISAGSAVLTLSLTAEAAQDDRRLSSETKSSRVILSLLLTIFVTAAGLTSYLEKTLRFPGIGIPSQLASHHGFSRERREQAKNGARGASGEMTSDVGDNYSGIVLWPKKQTYIRLVAPVPVLGRDMLGNTRSTTPLSIPFNGVYWFFKAPDVRPPKGSREVQGSPDERDIWSTDRRPLSIEAHQNLGNLIDLDCCSRIQIAIRNRDRYPETVSMELILINTRISGKPLLSLGKQLVTSTRPWKLYDDRAPVAEVLSFNIPANVALRRFDEVMIVFQLDPLRADAAAKIAIERLVLVPRGL